MSRAALSESELAEATASLDGWVVMDGRLTLQTERPSFPDAIELVRRVAEVAEELNHHPDIDIRWRTVTLSVCTHDAGNVITASDVELARRVDAIR